MVFATLAFLGAFGADQGLLTYFADLSGPGLPYARDQALAVFSHKPSVFSTTGMEYTSEMKAVYLKG